MDIDSITRAMADGIPEELVLELADVLHRITLAVQKQRGQQAAQLLTEPARTIASHFNLN